MIDHVGQHFGNYQVVKLLGKGGCAEVYLGKHRYLNSYAALKVLNARVHPGNEHKFLAEAQTLADLRHSNIVHLLDFAIESGIPVLTMDYAPKGSLRQYYPHGTHLPLTTVVDFAAQIAAGLQYAHNHHVIHRDVKPENILLDAEDRLLLSDFGLSLLTPSSEQLSTQDPAGTARYMAPEQVRGKPCFASDQYALAVMVYEWLCGELPFHGNMWQIWHQHLHAAPPPLRTKRPELPLMLEEVVLRALAKTPQERFVSVQAFALALTRACQTDIPEAANVLQVTASLQALPHSSPTTPPHYATALLSQNNQTVQIPTKAFTPVTTQQAPATTLQHQNRIRLLRRIRSIWITGVLEQSLHGAVLMELGLQEKPDALDNPWRLEVQETNRSPYPLPVGTSITKVYDEADGELLILGEPGAGKTTLLLELARTLLARAEQEEGERMPIVFNLSSWAMKHQPLAEWLVEELNSKYQVPQKVGKSWVDAGQVLPMLDGLDEVAKEYRAACVSSINAYQQKQGLGPLVVCSRTAEYLVQVTKVAVRKAVLIQPLTVQQINDYLNRAAGQLEGLQVVLCDDPSFRELANTPLMLSILALTYHGKSVEDIANRGSVEVLAAYVQRMFQRRKAETHYTAEQTTYWLTWLAKQMLRRNQTEFYIERLQIDWLSKSRQCQLYTSLIGGLVCLLIAGSVNGMVFGNFLDGLLIGLLNAVAFILLNGLLFVWLVERDVHAGATLHQLAFKRGIFNRRGSGLSLPCWPIDRLPGQGQAARRSEDSFFVRRLASLCTQFLLSRVGYGLLGGLFDGIFVGILKHPFDGLINGLISGLFLALLGKLDRKIQPLEIIVWSWTNVRRNAIKSLLGGLGIGLLFGLLPGLFNLSNFLPWLFFGLSIGLVIGLVILLVRGFSRDMLDSQRTLKPNQGIWNAFYHSTRLSLLCGLIFGLFFSLVIYRFFKIAYTAYIPPNSDLLYGAIDGLVIALLIWLINGGLACIQHLVLRVCLWQARCAPWNYPRFLDFASERILLRKVGGGYIFVHRLLLEYFASLDN